MWPSRLAGLLSLQVVINEMVKAGNYVRCSYWEWELSKTRTGTQELMIESMSVLRNALANELSHSALFTELFNYHTMP